MLLRNFIRCQTWIVNYNRLVIYFIISINLILTLNENKLFANCESNEDLLPSESVISRQDAGVGGLGGLLVPALVAMASSIPAKLIGAYTIYALKQQQMQNQQVTIPNGFGNGNGGDCANGKGKGKGGDCNGGNGGDNDGDDDDERGRKKTFMLFAGRGNVQVKNHDENEESADESMEKHYTLQMIDEEKGIANFNKNKDMSDMNGINSFINGLIPKKANKRWAKFDTNNRLNSNLRLNKFKNSSSQRNKFKRS